MIKKVRTVKEAGAGVAAGAMVCEYQGEVVEVNPDVCEGASDVCAPEVEAKEGAAVPVVRREGRVVTPGKKYYGERLKLFVEVCERWCLYGTAWNTTFVKDANALIGMGMLEYVCTDNGYMKVKPSEEGLDRYKTIVAGVFGEEVGVA